MALQRRGKNLNEGWVCNHSVAGDCDLRCVSALLATSCHRPPAHRKKCYPCGGHKAYQFCFVVTSADPLRLGRLPRCDTAALRCQDQQWFQLCLLTSTWLHSRGQFLVSTPLGASASPENALHTYADLLHTYFKASCSIMLVIFPHFLLLMSAFCYFCLSLFPAWSHSFCTPKQLYLRVLLPTLLQALELAKLRLCLKYQTVISRIMIREKKKHQDGAASSIQGPTWACVCAGFFPNVSQAMKKLMSFFNPNSNPNPFFFFCIIVIFFSQCLNGLSNRLTNGFLNHL